MSTNVSFTWTNRIYVTNLKRSSRPLARIWLWGVRSFRRGRQLHGVTQTRRLGGDPVLSVERNFSKHSCSPIDFCWSLCWSCFRLAPVFAVMCLNLQWKYKDFIHVTYFWMKQSTNRVWWLNSATKYIYSRTVLSTNLRYLYLTFPQHLKGKYCFLFHYRYLTGIVTSWHTKWTDKIWCFIVD